MSAFQNLIGQRFGRLTVTKFSHTNKYHAACWLCRCDCANMKIVTAGNLKSGGIKSCGCLKRDKAKLGLSAFKHGHARAGNQSPEYACWARMITRCENQNNKRYSDWGGRGVKICKRWRTSFKSFLADMGPRPPGTNGKRARYSLDRINNDGDYKPSNCRWATHKQQARNSRRYQPTPPQVKRSNR